MEIVPATLGFAFILTTALTVRGFYRAAHRSVRTLSVLLAWLLLQTGLSLSGVYIAPEAMPPRLALALIPALLVIGLLLLTRQGQVYVDGLRLETLTWLHVVRVPVELVLFGLFLHKVVPGLMTFEGRNWDILSGLSAPLVHYTVFRWKRLGRSALLGWNIFCLGSLLNVVGTALLAVPSPVQQLAFDQPNVAVLYFPYIWLPSCVVPLVLLSHLVAIRQLLRQPQIDLAVLGKQ